MNLKFNYAKRMFKQFKRARNNLVSKTENN